VEEAQQSNLHTTTDLITNPRIPQDHVHTRKKTVTYLKIWSRLY